MSDGSGPDPRSYRDMIGRFATGVTVVTTDDGSGSRGLTANAVSSVSLEPMLLLVCVDHKTTSYPFLQKAGIFCVNILGADQMDASNFFAGTTPTDNPMGDIAYRTGETGAPILDGVVAWADCRTWNVYKGGDHDIFVGEVVNFALERPEADPLLFFGGGYRAIAPA